MQITTETARQIYQYLQDACSSCRFLGQPAPSKLAYVKRQNASVLEIRVRVRVTGLGLLPRLKPFLRKNRVDQFRSVYEFLLMERFVPTDLLAVFRVVSAVTQPAVHVVSLLFEPLTFFRARIHAICTSMHGCL